MANVIAVTRGYYGLVVREIGERFEVPDDVWDDPKRRPKWCRLAAFGGKGDHDGDGKIGGSKPVEPKGIVVPADWQAMSATERKALAKAISGGNVPNAKEADAIISAYVEASAPAPFSDPPAPEVAAPVRASNEINDALGTTRPDWIAADGPVAVAD